MWQRFTERARKIVFYAQEEAGQKGENYVGTIHLLAGILRDPESVAARILSRMHVDLIGLRHAADAAMEQGDGQLGKDMQLTPGAKRVIDLAYDEAKRLDNNYIGSEHLLLGILRQEADPRVYQLLASAGVDLESAREQVVHLQEGSPSSQNTGAPTPEQTSVMVSTLDEARRLAAVTGYLEAEPKHLLLAVLILENGAARRVIDRLTTDTAPLIRALRAETAGEKREGPSPISSSSSFIVTLAANLAKSTLAEGQVSTDHLLLALSSGQLRPWMDEIGLTHDRILTEMRRMRDKEE